MAVTVEMLTLWLAGIARPLERWLEPGSAGQFLSELGLSAPELVADHPGVVAATAEVVTSVSDLAPLVPDLADALQDGDAADISAVVEEAAPFTAALIGSIHGLSEAIEEAAQEAGSSTEAVRRFAAELMERLFGYLLSVHLERTAPVAHDIAVFLGLIELTEVPEDDATPAHLRRVVRFDRLGPLLQDPPSVMAETYAWGTPDFDWDLFSRRLFHLLMATGFVSLGDDPDDGPPAVRMALVDIAPTADNTPGLRATTSVRVAADTYVARQLSEGVIWEAVSEGDLEQGTALELAPPAAFRMVPPTVETSGMVSTGIAIEDPDGGRMLLLGSVDGSRIEAKSVTVSSGAELRWQHEAGEAAGDLAFSVSIAGGRFVIDLSGADGFLRSLFPDAPAVDLDVGLAWSSSRGLHLEGAAGLTGQFPVDVPLGPVRIVSFATALDVSEEGLVVQALANATARLGPFAVAIDQVGAETVLSFPDGDGTFALVDLIARFAPPAGLGLSVAAGPAVGSGYLFFDTEDARYAGAVQLEAGGLAVNAVGLLTTRLPDDASGYSLLVLASSADFAPINLGFGFTLNGVGGLLGLDRSADIDELRTRLRGGGLDGLMFPDDPVSAADDLVGRLRETFPPTPGRHLVGPAALIGWGTPTVLTIEVVLALELPDPVRLVALAQLRARLPSGDQALVRLNMDALGVVDIDQGRASLNAVLYDSRVAAYAIDGEVALRARWLADPGFVLAAGGLHPRYQPPADFPDLEPLSIRLERGRAKLRLEAYLALTSNTVQVGARLTVDVSVGRFTIDGRLQFDTLFELSPFAFVADFAGGVRVRRGSRTLLGVYLEMTLSGPAPMHARGSAMIEVWRFSHSVSFDVTLDRGDPVPPAPPADPLPELLDALAEPGNWSAALSRDDRSVVMLRDVDRPHLALVHPLGELTVRQRVVPLEVEITRYGSTPLALGPRAYVVDVTLSGEAPVEAHTVRDHFAPAQFLELNDHDKLSAPAFERLPSGVRLEAADAVFGGQDDAGLMTSAPVGHRTRVVDSDGSARDASATTASADKVRGAAARRASVGADLRASHVRYRGPDLQVRVREPVYVLANVTDLRVERFADAGGSEGLSYTAATQLLRTRQGDGRSELQVVARHESIGALPGLLPPGASPEEPGIYEERGSYGARVPGARRVTMTPDSDPLPPTQAPGRRWQWVAPLAETA